MANTISNLSRDYTTIKNDLISFSQKYYPNLSTKFNDSSVGSWFIDLVASVGDSLNYAIDRNFQETMVDMSNSRETAMNNAKMNGLKVPGSKASTCEVQFSCTLPAASDSNLASPDWSYSPRIKRGAIIACGSYSFEVQENVDFKEQFNEDGFSNRTFSPNRNANGIIEGYTVNKTVIAVAGTTKVYKKVISQSELQPFMEVVLPDTDVMNVESIIFKESSNFNTSPKLYEYYINKEIWQAKDEAIYTHRYFEVDSLADQYVFVTQDDVNELDGKATSVAYEGFGEVVDGEGNATEQVRSSLVYKGRWLTVRNKFITEYTPSGYMKIIFGPSNETNTFPEGQTTYADYFMSNVINNQFLGVLPDANWTMFVLYRVGGGVETNIAPNSINTISYMNVETPYFKDGGNTADRNKAINSITVTNLSSAIGGKDEPSTKEIKYLTRYNTSSQGRCVTVKDYKARLMQIDPKFGCPFRANVIEENNKIVFSLLTMDLNGYLSKNISNEMLANMHDYLENYKMLNDYLEFRSGNIYNLGFSISIFIDKSYDTNEVATNIINTVMDYMDVNEHDMGEDIFIGDLQKEITNLDGVINIIDFAVYNLYGTSDIGNFNDKAQLPIYNGDNACSTIPSDDFGDSSHSYRIDLNKLEGLLPCDYNSMFEVKEPNKNIKLRIKLR